MASPNWLFVLTDIQGNQLGEVTNADSRKVILPLNRIPTATFSVPTSHYLSNYLLDPTWDGLLKCYRNGSIRFCGPVVSSQDTGDDQNQNIVVNAASPLWRLNYRLLGNDANGWTLGTAGTLYDLGYIAEQMLGYANSQGFTGISQGLQVATTNGSAGLYYFKPVIDAITELSASLNSFDFEAAPQEPTSIGQPWPEIAQLLCHSIGQVKSQIIFEYGTGSANVTGYSNSIDRTGLCTKAYIQQPAAVDHSGILTSTDFVSEANHGRFEALVDDGGVQWDDLRQAIADQNVKVRKYARRVISFTIAPNSAFTPFGGGGFGYIPGDQVRFRYAVAGQVRADVMMRIWGLTFDIDKNGNEVVSPQLLAP